MATILAVDMVISDINMPQINGISLTDSLRRLPGNGKTPILMLTSEDAQQ